MIETKLVETDAKLKQIDLDFERAVKELYEKPPNSHF